MLLLIHRKWMLTKEKKIHAIQSKGNPSLIFEYQCFKIIVASMNFQIRDYI